MVEANSSPLQENSCDDNINKDSVAAMKEAYRNVAANLAASAWGDDGADQCINSPGTFRNAGTLGKVNLVDRSLKSNDHTTYRSAFEPFLIRKEVYSPDPERTCNNYEHIHEVSLIEDR